MRSREAELDTRAPVGSRLAAVLRQAARTTVAASLASGSGLRQLTTLGALKVVVPAFVMIATGGGLLVLVAQPKQPVPIHVRWTRNVDAPRRAALERQLQLSDGRRIEGTTWVYMLRDPSTDEIRTIVTHPDVDDTAHVNRIWFRPELAHDRHRRAILSGGVAGVAGAVVVLLWKAIRLAETRRERE